MRGTGACGEGRGGAGRGADLQEVSGGVTLTLALNLTLTLTLTDLQEVSGGGQRQVCGGLGGRRQTVPGRPVDERVTSGFDRGSMGHLIARTWGIGRVRNEGLDGALEGGWRG